MRSRFSCLGLLLTLAACVSPPKPPPAAPSQAQEPVVRTAPPPRAVFPARDVRVRAGLLAPMPEPVTSFGAVSDDSYLYTLGGYNGEPHNYSREGQRRLLARLPLDGSGTWEELSELSHGLQGLALVHHAGKLCRVGGTEARNQDGAAADLHSLAEAACFDPIAKSWTDLPPLPVGRSSLDAAVLNGTLYVAGGWTLRGAPAGGTWPDELLALDLNAAQPAWSAIKAPFQRRALGVASAAGKLVIVGGITPEGDISRRVDLYDPSSGSFSVGPDFPDDAFGIAVESMGDAVVASAVNGLVYRWKVGDSRWEPVARLSFGRFFHHLLAAGPNQLVALGGISGMHNEGRTAHVERVVLGAPEARMVAWSMAYPGSAKNRQGIFVHGDYVYLFGGNNSLEQHDFAPHNFVSQTLRLHLPSLQFAEVEPFPKARQTMQTVSQEERGVALGGFGHDGEKAVSFADGYNFDFQTEHWSEGARLPESRTQFGLAQHGGELWVFGGLHYDPTRGGEEAFQHVESLLRGKADPGSLFANAGVSLPAPRRAFAGAVLGDDYFLLGGMRGGFELVEDCLRYSFKTQTFTPFSCPGQARLSGALVPVGDKLYLAGGSIRAPGSELLVAAHDMVELDPKTLAFRSFIAELPFDTRHMQAVAYQGRILLISTHNEQGRIELALIDPAPLPFAK